MGGSRSTSSTAIIRSNSYNPPKATSLGVFYPQLGTKSKLYEDVRAKYLLAFWKYSRTLTQHSYQRPKLNQLSKKMVALALSEFPIRSVEEYAVRFAKTADIEALKEILQSGGVDRTATPIDTCRRDGRYYSIPEACLVSILGEVESRATQANCQVTTNHHRRRSADEDLELESLLLLLQGKDYWVSLADLIPMTDARLRDDCCPAKLTRRQEADHGAAHYTNPSTRSAEYKQLEKLLVAPKDETMGYLKAHHLQGQLSYELTSLGYRTAVRIRKRTFPAAPGHYRCSNLRQVEPRYQGICLGVDRQEGGGGHNKLHTMCGTLDMVKLPYFVGTLKIGDYCFFTGNRLCPILVERKSIQDLAMSIYDGRWHNQKHRMYHGQYVFGYDNCRMAYIIEGKEEAQQVTGDYIGHRKFNVTRERLDQEIENLQKEGFDVLRTT
jgi:hypothetical protein